MLNTPDIFHMLPQLQALVHNSNAAWAQMNRYHRQRISGPLPGGNAATPGAKQQLTRCLAVAFVLVVCLELLVMPGFLYGHCCG
jgi:hypothetical protein